MKASLAVRVVIGQATKRTLRLSPGWFVILAVLVGLTALALAESVWLEEALPQDHVSRTSLMVIPRATGAGSDAWADMTLDLASQDEVLVGVVKKLDLRDRSTGEPVSPAQLRQRVRFLAQCVQVLNGEGVLVRGALLSATVRGLDAEEVSAIAGAWEEALLQTSPSLAAKPLEGPTTPYLPCEGR